jgi:hypothetical protein
MKISPFLVSGFMFFGFVVQHAVGQPTVRVPSRAAAVDVSPDSKACWLFPMQGDCMGTKDERNSNINKFYGTANNVSFFNQIKSIYNGASSSATVSANLASLNFGNGMQVNAITNVQAGSSNTPTAVNNGTLPTLSSASAGQATQNMLYGGTIVGAVIYPVIAIGIDRVGSTDGFGTLIDLIGKEGVDIQNFKAGTSITANSPPSHGSVQVEGYLQYNSINISAASNSFAGAVFIGGSYGYSYTSHAYARDYGFGTNVNNSIGQISGGILISGVAKIAVSRAFGPSQIYTDSTSMKAVNANNFKAWSFGISYQSPPPK